MSHESRWAVRLVIGPSGCGKSTLFQMLVGILRPDSGAVSYFGELTKEPFSAYMLQKDLLFPWLTDEDNAALGLTLGGTSKKDARKKGGDLLSTFRLDGYAKAVQRYAAAGWPCCARWFSSGR